MASTVTVFETAARRTVIKVTPGKYLHEIRAEACEKFRLDTDKYGLKHNNKTLDISAQFRLSGLPSGAKLELVQLSRSAGVVSIALQLPSSEASSAPNGRLVDKFPSTTTLWQVLRKFEDGVAGAVGSRRNLTARGVPKTLGGDSGAGRLYYEQPVLTIVNRDYGSFVDLQKTLSSLGLNSGNVLAKLNFRVADQPLEEAQLQIGRYFEEIEGSRRELDESRREEEQPRAPSATETILSPTSIPDNLTTPQPSDAPSNDGAAQSVPVQTAEPTPVTIDGVSERPITVFSAPSNTTPKAAAAAYNPADYEFTLDHAKSQAAAYQAAGRNKPLPSDAEIEAQKAAAAAKIAAIKSVQIKARFPDQTSVVTEFSHADAGQDLYAWVSGLMVHGDAPFVLRWAGPKGMADVPSNDKKLIHDVGMAGRVQVTLTWKEGATPAVRTGPVLKEKVNNVAQEIQVQGLPEPPRPGEATGSSESKESSGEVQGERKKKAMPAWLKKSLPGKK